MLETNFLNLKDQNGLFIYGDNDLRTKFAKLMLFENMTFNDFMEIGIVPNGGQQSIDFHCDSFILNMADVCFSLKYNTMSVSDIVHLVNRLHNNLEVAVLFDFNLTCFKGLLKEKITLGFIVRRNFIETDLLEKWQKISSKLIEASVKEGYDRFHYYGA